MDKIMGLLRPTEKQPVSKGQFFHLNLCMVDLCLKLSALWRSMLRSLILFGVIIVLKFCLSVQWTLAFQKSVLISDIGFYLRCPSCKVRRVI